MYCRRFSLMLFSVHLFPWCFLTVFMFPFKGVKFYKKFPLVLLLQQISSQLIYDISYLPVYVGYLDMSKSGWSPKIFFFLELSPFYFNSSVIWSLFYHELASLFHPVNLPSYFTLWLTLLLLLTAFEGWTGSEPCRWRIHQAPAGAPNPQCHLWTGTG